MTDNPFRRMLELKELDGGWARPGRMADDGRGCLIANLSRVFGLAAEDEARYDEAIELLGPICQEQTGHSRLSGAIVVAHNCLVGDELDRIVEKAAVAWDERI